MIFKNETILPLYHFTRMVGGKSFFQLFDG